MKKTEKFSQLTSAVLSGANRAAVARNYGEAFPAGKYFTLSVLLLMLLLSLPNRGGAQTCDCSDFPGYKCITTGNLPQFLGHELLDYGDAETIPQYVVVFSDINFSDPNNPNPYHFAAGSQILMMPGASLFIRKEVVFTETNFFGCSIPWSSIEVFNGGTLRLMGGSIANACRAVVLKASSKAEIVSINFAANRICIDVEGNAQLLGEGLAHNTFDGTSMPSCSGAGANPRAIRVAGASYFKIGDQGQSGAPNKIKNYEIGISTTNSDLDLFNTTIVGSGSGTGILLSGTGGVFTARITGLGHTSNAPEFIKDFATGIDAHNYNLSLNNAFLKNSARHLINIEQNDFPASAG